ncbi:MAG: nucleotide exchange factor GrpE [Planctomycetes bacterium]|nr:nucleotide exchange factor GrpE [Planctomycetota bacterium]
MNGPEGTRRRDAFPAAVRDSLARIWEEYCSFLLGFVELRDHVECVAQLSRGPEADRWTDVGQRAFQLLLMHGIRPTAREGQRLDLRYHEVVEKETREGVAPDTITEVLRPGYEIVVAGFAPRILRYAKVIIASGTDGGEPGGEGASAGESGGVSQEASGGEQEGAI